MTEDRLDLIFEECLRQIQNGASLEQVLKAYPAYESKLRPPLEMAVLASSIRSRTGISSKVQANSRLAFMDAVASSRGTGRWFSVPPILRSAWTMGVFILIVTVGLIWTGLASAKALPGDSLYPLKLTAERTRLLVAGGPVQKLQLENEFDQERAGEVEALVEQDRHTEVTFAGFLVHSANHGWLVNQVPIILPEPISNNPSLQEGDYVDVHGVPMRDGTVMVEWILQKTTQFNGKVEEILPDEWTVSGVHLQINKNTRINGDPKIGALVAVEAVQRINHDLVARSVTIKSVWQDLLDLVPERKFVNETPTSEPEIQSSPGSETSPVEVHQPSPPSGGNEGEHGDQPTPQPAEPATAEPQPTVVHPTEKPEAHQGDITPTPEEHHGDGEGSQASPTPKPSPTIQPSPTPQPKEDSPQPITPTGSDSENH